VERALLRRSYPCAKAGTSRPKMFIHARSCLSSAKPVRGCVATGRYRSSFDVPRMTVKAAIATLMLRSPSVGRSTHSRTALPKGRALCLAHAETRDGRLGPPYAALVSGKPEFRRGRRFLIRYNPPPHLHTSKSLR